MEALHPPRRHPISARSRCSTAPASCPTPPRPGPAVAISETMRVASSNPQVPAGEPYRLLLLLLLLCCR